MVIINRAQEKYHFLNMCILCRYARFSQAQSHIPKTAVTYLLFIFPNNCYPVCSLSFHCSTYNKDIVDSSVDNEGRWKFHLSSSLLVVVLVNWSNTNKWIVNNSINYHQMLYTTLLTSHSSHVYILRQMMLLNITGVNNYML